MPSGMQILPTVNIPIKNAISATNIMREVTRQVKKKTDIRALPASTERLSVDASLSEEDVALRYKIKFLFSELNSDGRYKQEYTNAKPRARVLEALA